MASKSISKILFTNYKSQDEIPIAQALSQPHCQSKVKFWYVVYRWLLFLCWKVVILCSVLEIGTSDKAPSQKTWLIYLTNWDLVLGATQSLLGAIVVTRRRRLQNNFYFDADQMQLGIFEKLFWFLHVVTVTLALSVTIIYWTLVHDPEIHSVDPLNILIHGFNSVLMMVDFFIAGVPFEMKTIWWCPVVMSSYVTFNFVYYLSGGQDKFGNHFVYKILDWKKPNETLTICFGVFLFVVTIHSFLCCLAWFRDLACRSVFKKAQKLKATYVVNY